MEAFIQAAIVIAILSFIVSITNIICGDKENELDFIGRLIMVVLSTILSVMFIVKFG